MSYAAHPSALIDKGAQIGKDCKIWHFVHICSEAYIGESVSIGQNVFVGNNVVIGNRCKIQNNVSLYDGVVLEEAVFCGPSCVFTNVNNPRSDIIRKDEFRKTLVRKGATIGANATIVCGVELGKYCFIAAGAVVTKNVPDYALMAGTPAKRIGWMSKLGGRLGDNLICPIDGTLYTLSNEDNLQEVIK